LIAVDHQGPHCEATIVSRVIGRRTVVAVQGEIDLDTAPALVDAIAEALSAGAAELWIDLTDTEFMTHRACTRCSTLNAERVRSIAASP
jgi:anti-anti-sigma factor